MAKVKKVIKANSTCLCDDCEGKVLGLLNELKAQAVKQKRGGLILDAIGDLEVSILDGNINLVKRRDSAWSHGNGKTFGRRFKVTIE